MKNSRLHVKCKVEQILSIPEHPSVHLGQTGPPAASAARWAEGAGPASYSDYVKVKVCPLKSRLSGGI